MSRKKDRVAYVQQILWSTESGDREEHFMIVRLHRNSIDILYTNQDEKWIQCTPPWETSRHIIDQVIKEYDTLEQCIADHFADFL